MKVRPCELCKEQATVYCPSDAAFLCHVCDMRVHGANFLVARHVRQSLCSTCHGPLASSPTCPGEEEFEEDQEEDSIDDSLSSSSSVCNSSTTDCDYSTAVNDAKRKKNQREMANNNCNSSNNNVKGIFVDWCGKLGLVVVGHGDCLIVRTSCAALKFCTERLTFLPFRVALVASLWLGLRLGGRSSALTTWQVAKRLEEISGVRVRVILAVGSKLERAAWIGRRLRRDQRDLQEGWAESSRLLTWS